MVKLPGMDELKKMGSGLIDSAKSVKIGDMVDRLKTGVEAMTKKGSGIPQSNEEVKKLFEDIHAELDQLTEAQTKVDSAVRKIHGQLVELAKAFEANQPSEEKKT